MMQKGDPFEELTARSHHLADASPSPPVASTLLPSTTRRRAKDKLQQSHADLQTKRKRHADAERERIHRKQSGVARMRDEVQQLEQQLHSLSASSPQTLSVLPWHTHVPDDGAVATMGPIAKRELYVRALTESGWLRREKASLQAKLDDCGLLQTTVESLLEDLIDATTTQPTQPQAREDATRHMSYRDVLSNECYELMRDLVNESKRFTIHADSPRHDVVNALDWSALCQHDGKDVRFSLTKTFPEADLEELASSVWLTFHDLAVSQKIFSSRLRLEVLQRISDDVLIVRWQIDCRKVVPYVGNCRNLVFRWKTPDGYFVGCRTIDDVEPVGGTQSNPTNGAFDQFYWAKLTQSSSGNACQATFAGRVGVGNGTSAFARFLCTEIPIAIFRWESMVVGPLFNFNATGME